MKNFLLADTNQAVIEAVLDALYDCTIVEALYIQNFEKGMLDDQLRKLATVLKRGRIWVLNVGENFGISNEAWAAFAEELRYTNVTHMYANSEHTLPPKIKLRMRDIIRENRKTDRRHRSLEHFDVIRQIGQMWWNPRLPICRALARNARSGCFACHSNVAEDSILQCSGRGCHALYHIQCVAVGTCPSDSKNWKCPTCRERAAEGNRKYGTSSKERQRIATMSGKAQAVLVSRCNIVGRSILVCMSSTGATHFGSEEALKEKKSGMDLFVGQGGKCMLPVLSTATKSTSSSESRKTGPKAKSSSSSIIISNSANTGKWRIGHIIRQRGRRGPVLIRFEIFQPHGKGKKSEQHEQWVKLDGADGARYCLATEMVWAKRNGNWWPAQVFSFSDDCIAEVRREQCGERFVSFFLGQNDKNRYTYAWIKNVTSNIVPMQPTVNVSSPALAELSPASVQSTTTKALDFNIVAELGDVTKWIKVDEESNVHGSKDLERAKAHAIHELCIHRRLQAEEEENQRVRRASEVARSQKLTPHKIHFNAASDSNGPPSPGHMKKKRIVSDGALARALIEADRFSHGKELAERKVKRRKLL
eukprot:g1920.t1